MLEAITQFFRAYRPIEVAFELAVIWAVLYLVYRFLATTRGAGILRGLAVVVVLLFVGIRLIGEAFGALERLRYIGESLLNLLAILLIVVFQPELRQGMVRLSEIFSRSAARGTVVDAVADAVDFLSKNQFGAIIVFERTVNVAEMIEGGVRLDAIVSERLIESIFYPNNPLHDLAVIIRNDRVVAANVQLPLADPGVVPPELGSRPRAATGVTMETDSLAVVVSEERGTIRIAERGRISAPISRDDFAKELATRLAATEPPGTEGEKADEPREVAA